MAITVCCPTCWKWSELGTLKACKKCGTPLLLTDGRRVDEVPDFGADAPPPPPPPEPPPVELAPVGWSVRAARE